MLLGSKPHYSRGLLPSKHASDCCLLVPHAFVVCISNNTCIFKEMLFMEFYDLSPSDTQMVKNILNADFYFVSKTNTE